MGLVVRVVAMCAFVGVFFASMTRTKDKDGRGCVVAKSIHRFDRAS